METARVTWDGKREISMVYGLPVIEDLSRSPILVIAHGAGKGMGSRFITYFHVEMARRGFLTVKFNFPYMEARWRLSRTPDPKPVLVGSFRTVLDHVKSRVQGGKLFIGGLSMGAAVASHVAANKPGRGDIDGLFYFSYPIHRPGKPDELGISHLFHVSKPMLFISGTRDPYSRPEQLKDLVSKIGPRARLHLVDGGDHNLNTRKGAAIYYKTLDRSATVMEEWVNSELSPKR